jgi:hypothetical protein
MKAAYEPTTIKFVITCKRCKAVHALWLTDHLGTQTSWALDSTDLPSLNVHCLLRFPREEPIPPYLSTMIGFRSTCAPSFGQTRARDGGGATRCSSRHVTDAAIGATAVWAILIGMSAVAVIVGMITVMIHDRIH